MSQRVEKVYGKILGYIIFFISPIKQKIYKPNCGIHKLINFQALEILKNDNYLDPYTFFSDYILYLNEGVEWADQDLKSLGHFYNPDESRGLYGREDALSICRKYYKMALESWKNNNIQTAMFYLGASVHIIQDVTIPQHANIKLLDNHKKYENFIRKYYMVTPKFMAYKGGCYLENLDDFVRNNAKSAITVYEKLRHIKDDTKRFYITTKFILPLAQKTTAGCFLMFYKDASKLR